jgi:hypothetical protein
MSSQLEAPHPNGAVTTNEPPRRSLRRRRIVLAVLVLVGIAWGYAIWYSVTRDAPEDLDDAAQAAIERACAPARDALIDLPDFGAESTAADDVALVRQENAIFETMVTDIEAVEPETEDARAALAGWAEDWRELLAARTAFADDLEADGTARLQIPAVSSGSVQPITDRMDEYAGQQGMTACQVQLLQAEVVDVPRVYLDPDDV